MSALDAEAAASVPSPAGEHTDDEMTDAEEQDWPNTAPLTQPQEVPPMQAKGKRYIPPRPNANTFATQQEFLESLQPIELEQVDEDKRKCPICWKKFGEDPDPGFDNSELPVKLRCNHCFGHKCLASLFRLPETSRLALEPFSSVPGKRGYLLGEKLLTYRLKHESDVRNDVEIFQDMIKKAADRKVGLELFGRYWVSIIQDITSSSGQYGYMTGLTIMENAVLMAFDGPPISDKELSPFQNSVHQFLEQAPHFSQFLDQDPESGFYGGYPMSALPPLSPPLPLPTDPQQSPVAASSSESSPNDQSTVVSSSPAIDQSTTPDSSPEQDDSDSGETWQEVLAKETNLDKLSALMKKKAGKAGFSEIEAKYKALKILEADRQKNARLYLGMQCTHHPRVHQTDQTVARKTRQTERAMKLLAMQLANVFAEHKLNRPETLPLATPDSPPLLLRVSLKIRKDDIQKTSHMIVPPAGIYAFGNDEDNDSDEEEDVNLRGYTIMIHRSCSIIGGLPKDVILPTPKELTWQSQKKTPDDCPVCHSVLFKKARVENTS
jgi:hypothetical protein